MKSSPVLSQRLGFLPGFRLLLYGFNYPPCLCISLQSLPLTTQNWTALGLFESFTFNEFSVQNPELRLVWRGPL